MRMRHKPWADDFLAENADIAISNPADYKGKWNTVFGNDNPIHIEVGTGKGQFISGMAKQNPDINYIGIELFKSVIVTAVQKVKDSEAQNVKLASNENLPGGPLFYGRFMGGLRSNDKYPWTVCGWGM